MPEMVKPGVLAWGAENIQDEALEQAAATSRLPFVEGHLALMPDAHWGKGACIGSVIPTHGAIVPSAVGVDIGCGMIAVETTLRSADLGDNLDNLMVMVGVGIPAGMGKGKGQHEHAGIGWDRFRKEYGLPDGLDLVGGDDMLDRAARQFGSLGSGNHFVEVCLDENDIVWGVIHSGSRGIGHALASMHIDKAKRLAAQWFIPLEDPDLAYLVQGTPEFEAYLRDLRWSQGYAQYQREAMMNALVDALSRVSQRTHAQVESRRINCHHNYTTMEQHHGKNLWITRKGAISARVSQSGVIPGSMGTSTYIVRGLGDPASYTSSAHGAGRAMGRKVAKKTLTPASLVAAMGDRTWNVDQAEALVDESPAAYKQIDKVMASQSDLVAIEHTLRQVLNYKGT